MYNTLYVYTPWLRRRIICAYKIYYINNALQQRARSKSFAVPMGFTIYYYYYTHTRHCGSVVPVNWTFILQWSDCIYQCTCRYSTYSVQCTIVVRTANGIIETPDPPYIILCKSIITCNHALLLHVIIISYYYYVHLYGPLKSCNVLI